MKEWYTDIEKVSKDISQKINTINQSFDLANNISLYNKLLKYNLHLNLNDDLDGLEHNKVIALKSYFDDDKVDTMAFGIFCSEFESFIKKLYFILEENNFVDDIYKIDRTARLALSPFFKSLNKIRPLFISDSGQVVDDVNLAAKDNEGSHKIAVHKETGKNLFIKLLKDKVSFDKYVDEEDKELEVKFNNTFELYLIKSVILRNKYAHQSPSFSGMQSFNNMLNVLTAELLIIDFFKNELNTIFKAISYNHNDVLDYLNQEIERISKVKQTYVSLSLKELQSQVGQVNSGLIEVILKQKKGRIRILGQGGAGKSTTLEYLFYNDAINKISNPEESALPVLVLLSDLSGDETILDHIAKKINVDIEYIKELMQIGGVKFYFDGVNEILGDRQSKQNKLLELKRILQEYPDLPVVITDRYDLDDYQNNMFSVPTFVIESLNGDQVRAFVLKYCGGLTELENRVIDIIERNNNLLDLFNKPLLLTRAIEIIKVENELPNKEGKIIKKFIDILKKKKKDEKMDPLLNIFNFKLLLSSVANEMYGKSKSNSPITQFKFLKLLAESADNLGIEKSNSGYIIRIGYELDILTKRDQLIQFYHQRYFEFFVAHYLKNTIL